VGVVVFLFATAFAREHRRQEQNETRIENGCPSLTKVVGRQERIEGHITGKEHSAEVIAEKPEA
jgi:hypothetical protein